MNTTVCICMLTYKRGLMLERALESLSALRFAKNPDISIELVLIDNDSLGSGEAIYRRVAPRFSYRTQYVIEAAQGIANARNRALVEGGRADFIALIDDDETADPYWIDELVTVQRAFDADVVGGPVLPIYEDAPAWIVQGGFFYGRKEKTGERIKIVESNNVLIRKKYVNEFRFDLRFNSTSGEDTHFFLQMEGAGAKMVWAADAKVSEFIPRQRTSAEWLIERAQSDANRYTRALLYLSPGPLTRLQRLATAVGSLAVGVLLVCSGFTRRRRVTGLRKISRFIGTVKALMGSAQQYYAPGQVLR